MATLIEDSTDQELLDRVDKLEKKMYSLEITRWIILIGLSVLTICLLVNIIL
jgi:hypothetical protein